MSGLIDLLVQVIIGISTRAWLVFMAVAAIMAIVIVIVTLT